MFNHWDHIDVVTGDNKARLPVLQNNFGGNRMFTTSGISVAASRIGFFGVEPVTRRDTYYVRPLDESPLALLLRGLSLIGCEEYGSILPPGPANAEHVVTYAAPPASRD